MLITATRDRSLRITPRTRRSSATPTPSPRAAWASTAPRDRTRRSRTRSGSATASSWSPASSPGRSTRRCRSCRVQIALRERRARGDARPRQGRGDGPRDVRGGGRGSPADDEGPGVARRGPGRHVQARRGAAARGRVDRGEPQLLQLPPGARVREAVHARREARWCASWSWSSSASRSRRAGA